jgi:hypothetical protein
LRQKMKGALSIVVLLIAVEDTGLVFIVFIVFIPEAKRKRQNQQQLKVPDRCRIADNADLGSQLEKRLLVRGKRVCP